MKYNTGERVTYVCYRDFRDYNTGGDMHEKQEGTSHMCVVGTIGIVTQKSLICVFREYRDYSTRGAIEPTPGHL